jgi:hypothetical protein
MMAGDRAWLRNLSVSCCRLMLSPQVNLAFILIFGQPATDLRAVVCRRLVVGRGKRERSSLIP